MHITKTKKQKMNTNEFILDSKYLEFFVQISSGSLRGKYFKYRTRCLNRGKYL